MSNCNVYQGGKEYANAERSYPSVSLIYDSSKPDIGGVVLPKKGCFIETTTGDLIAASNWDDSKTPNNIYCSDGYRVVRIALEWCNENNCSAICATNNGSSARPSGITSGLYYKDDGQGTKYGSSTARRYRLRSGYSEPVRWDTYIDGLHYYDTYDWEGKAHTKLIKDNFEDIKIFPAVEACTTYTSPKGEQGYLMSISEWLLVYSFKNLIKEIDNLLGYTDGDLITGDAGWVWSVSRCGEYGFWILLTGSYGGVCGYNPYCYYYVRPAF